MNSKQTFKIPAFELKIPIKKSIFGDLPKDELCKNIQDYCLMSEELYEKVSVTASFAEWFYPGSLTKEIYQNLVRFFLIYFVFDDNQDKSDPNKDLVLNQLYTAYDKILNRDPVIDISWKPSVLYCFAVNWKISEQFNDQQIKRYFQSLKVFCDGNIEENSLVSSGYKFKSFEELLKFRFRPFGADLAFNTIEYACGITLTDEEYTDQLVQEFLDLAKRMCILINDIYSFEKEFNTALGQLDKVLNTVALTIILDKCTQEQALEKVLQYLLKTETKCLEVADKLISDPNRSESLKIFVKNSEYLVGGTYMVSIRSKRYNEFFN